jgi:hypothetical protein
MFAAPFFGGWRTEVWTTNIRKGGEKLLDFFDKLGNELFYR